MPEMQKADPGARKRAILSISTIFLAGLIMIIAWTTKKEAFMDWLTQDPARMANRVRLTLAGLAAMVAVPVLAFSVYLWLLGSRVIAGESFPPAGMAVTRDTAIVRGPGARCRGRAMQFGAVLAAISACMICTMLWYLARFFK